MRNLLYNKKSLKIIQNKIIQCLSQKKVVSIGVFCKINSIPSRLYSHFLNILCLSPRRHTYKLIELLVICFFFILNLNSSSTENYAPSLIRVSFYSKPNYFFFFERSLFDILFNELTSETNQFVIVNFLF
jgi:hypothetical protein